MEFKVVHKGIDSLYMSFWGPMKAGLLDELEQKKLLAKSEDPREQALAVKIIGEHNFEVMDRGRGKYSYVMVDNWFHIQISSSQRMIMPTIYVQISSELLNCLGFDHSMNELRAVVNNLLSDIDREEVSRPDLFVDFVSDMDFEQVKRKSWVTWAEQIHEYWTGADFTGWTVGRGGAISARLYDKTVEIVKSHKNFFIPIWLEHGWQAGHRVWRLEFQLRKEFLMQMSVVTVGDLMDLFNDIWRYCTQDWLRLAIDDGTENRTRWQNEPVWTCIQEVSFGAGIYSGIVREVDRSRLPSDRTLFLNGMGYLLSYQALKGYETTSDAAFHFLGDAEKFLNSYTRKSDQYLDADDYKNVKLNLKRRRFNKILEQTGNPLDGNDPGSENRSEENYGREKE